MLRESGIDREAFENAQKATYGDALSSLNSVDTIGNLAVDFHFNNREVFKYFDAIVKAAPEDLEKRLEKILDTENTTLSVVKGE